MDKYVMKNTKTNQYWCAEKCPQICDSAWDASKYNSASECQSALNVLMSDKYGPSDFKPVKLVLAEESVST